MTVPKKGTAVGSGSPSSVKPPSPWATGGFQEEMRLSPAICWGAWLGCGVPGSPTVRSAVLFEASLHPHLTEGAFIFPVTLPEKRSAKPLHLSRNACSLLQTHHQAHSVPLTDTPTHVHTLPHPLCDPRGRGTGLRRPLGGGQGVNS